MAIPTMKACTMAEKREKPAKAAALAADPPNPRTFEAMCLTVSNTDRNSAVSASELLREIVTLWLLWRILMRRIVLLQCTAMSQTLSVR